MFQGHKAESEYPEIVDALINQNWQSLQSSSFWDRSKTFNIAEQTS